MTGSLVMTMVIFGSDGNNDLTITIMKTWYGVVWCYMVRYGVVCYGAVLCGMVRTWCNLVLFDVVCTSMQMNIDVQ